MSSYYYGSETTVQLKSSQEVKLEQQILVEKKKEGEIIGEQWVKTEQGWSRAYDPQKTYKGMH